MKYFVKPVEGRSVPKPDGTPLKPEGEFLAKATWWKRRKRDGDVVITADAPKATKKKEA